MAGVSNNQMAKTRECRWRTWALVWAMSGEPGHSSGLRLGAGLARLGAPRRGPHWCMARGKAIRVRGRGSATAIRAIFELDQVVDG